MLFAAAFGSREEVALLLAAGAGLNVVDARGINVLHAAAAQSGTDVLTPLLASDLSVNKRNKAGVSAGDIAAGRGFASITKELEGNG